MTSQDRDPRMDAALATKGSQSATGWIIGILALLAIVSTVYFLTTAGHNKTASNDTTSRPAASTPTPSPAPAPNR